KRNRLKERIMTRVVPGWLRVEDGRFVPVPEKVAIVKRIFRDTIDGIGIQSINRIFNQESIVPIGKQTRTWHHSYIAKILHNRAVLGEFQPQKRGEATEGRKGRVRVPAGPINYHYFPRIITDEEWYKAHAALHNRRLHKGRTGNNGKSVANLFSGILYDAR